MPREITDKEAILSGLKSHELTSELFLEVNGKLKNAGDLEVIVEGKVNPAGKRVGPYVRLLTYDGGETIMRQGEWGGNTFYLSVNGALDVYIGEPGGEQRKISRLPPGACFGEMAVLAGVERNATVIVPKHETAVVLEVTRPALRLLRKLPKFGQVLDETYRVARTRPGAGGFDGIRRRCKRRDRSAAARNRQVHGLRQTSCALPGTTPVENVILIKSGWVRRVRGVPLDPASTGVAVGMGQTIGVDFLGAGNCLGLEGLSNKETWKYSASAMARTEVLEIPVAALAAEPKLRSQILRRSPLSPLPTTTRRRSKR